ncbi:hypothetical protein IWW46_006505, partial [Coemansia sp. RSA 2440]
MAPPKQDHYLMSAYGGDDEAEEHLVHSANTDSTQHSYLNSPVVDDDSVSVHQAQPRRPAHQLSLRRAAERNEARAAGLHTEPLYEYEYEDHNQNDYATNAYGYDEGLNDYGYNDNYRDQGSFTSLSKPYGRREYADDTDEQYRIMEKLDDSHRDREYVSRPSRGPSMYQRMRLMDEGDDEGDTPLQRASSLLRRQLSKRRSGAPDGAMRRSLLGNGGSSESYGEGNIPLQELNGGGDRHMASVPGDTGGSEPELAAQAAPAFGADGSGSFRTVHIGNRESNAQY